MTYDQFIETISAGQPPSGISILLQSLWYDAKGNWDKAHDLINDLTDKDSAHVHAYLHRKEGDAGNARYWYSRAGQPPSNRSLPDEWKELVNLYTEK